MPDIRIQLQGDAELRRVMGDPQFIRGPLRNFLTRSAFIVERAAKERAPVDTGQLGTSIITVLTPTSAHIGPTVHYAPHVEYGTRPHWPPQGTLQPWARRHGFPAGKLGDFLVRRAIARRGTRAQPYMRPAARASFPAILAEFNRMILEIRAKWSGHAV